MMAGWGKLGDLSRQPASRYTGQMARQNTTMVRDELPLGITTCQIDAILIDPFAPAGAFPKRDPGESIVLKLPVASPDGWW